MCKETIYSTSSSQLEVCEQQLHVIKIEQKKLLITQSTLLQVWKLHLIH